MGYQTEPKNHFKIKPIKFSLEEHLGTSLNSLKFGKIYGDPSNMERGYDRVRVNFDKISPRSI